MTESRRRAPPLWVERFLSDALSERERGAFLAVCSDEELARLQAEHRALAAELTSRMTPAEFARRVRARAQRECMQQKLRVQPWRVLALAVLISGVAFIAKDALRPLELGSEQRGASTREQGVESERAKGLAPSLRVYRRRADGPELLAYGQRVQSGDVLQLGYIAPGMTHAVLLSIDGRSEVTLHFPASPNDSAKLADESGEQLLPAAYELDDAPRFERFVLVSAARPLRTKDVLRAARDLARRTEAARDQPLALPAHAVQVSVLLDKGGS